AWTAAELCRQRMRLGGKVLVLAGCVDEGVVAGSARRAGGGRRSGAGRRRPARGGRRRRCPGNLLPDRLTARPEPASGRYGRANSSAGQRDTHVDLVLEIVRADDAVGRHAALAVASQEEAIDIRLADGADDRIDNVLEVLVVSRSPRTNRRSGRHDDELVLVLDVEERCVVALPVRV